MLSVNEKLAQKDTRQVDRSKRKRPTHFISLQITNPEVGCLDLFNVVGYKVGLLFFPH